MKPVSVQRSFSTERLSTMASCLLLATLSCCILVAWSYDQNEYANGCKIIGNTCKCGYGLRSEYIYKTRRLCSNAIKLIQAATAPPPLPERVYNICYNMPCARGICTQTTNDPGFNCKCDSTGYYGQRCEKACPVLSFQFNGMVFPHECIVI